MAAAGAKAAQGGAKEERIIAADPVADPQGCHARAHQLQLEQTIAAVRR